MLGMMLFFVDQLPLSAFWGNIVALISLLCFAWMMLFWRKQKNADPFHSMMQGNITAAAAALPFMFRPVPCDDNGKRGFGIYSL